MIATSRPKDRGDFLLGQITSSLNRDCDWHRHWTAALMTVALRASPDNRAAVARWHAVWWPRALHAAQAFAPVLGDGAAALIAASRDRELENALERALILAGADEIGPTLLSLASPLARAGEDAAGALLTEGFNLDQFERDLLLAALARTQGNKSAAARLLGITRRRLYSRLESLDAHPPGTPDSGDIDPTA